MTAPARGRLQNRLGARLALAIGLALTPLTVLAYLQARDFEAGAIARAEQALLGQTQLAAAPLIDQITDAAATAKAMAAIMPALVDRPGACSAAFAQVAAMSPAVLFAGFVPLDGLVTCSSTGAVHYLPDTPARRDLLENPRPVLTVNASGAVSGQSVLILSHPVWDDGGGVLGFVSISLAHRALNRDLPAAGDDPDARPLALATFAADGTVLTAALGIDTVAQRLPADRTLADLAGGGTQTFTTRNASGEMRSLPSSRWRTGGSTSWGPGRRRPRCRVRSAA